MSRKYALVNNGVVTAVSLYEEEEISSIKSDLIIDIENILPQPNIGWVLVGNKLEIPTSVGDREKFEIELNDKKTNCGIKLSRDAVNRIGARNKILNKTGTQVSVLLNQLVGVKMLLETGALGTARYSCIQLKNVYTEYSDIFDIVINEINSFESTFGL